MAFEKSDIIEESMWILHAGVLWSVSDLVYDPSKHHRLIIKDVSGFTSPSV